MAASRASLSRAAALSLVACAVVVAPARGETVELRGESQPMQATRVEFEPDGLHVTGIGGVKSVLAWDRVRAVEGVALDDSARQLLSIADDLWRARSRVQRGDLAMARPLLEQHFPRFRGTSSETALIVAEGLLRCRLATNDWMSGLVPAFEVARLRRAGITTDRFVALDPVLDEGTLLCPALPPAWDADDSTRAIAAELAALPAPADADLARAREIYVALLNGAFPNASPTAPPAARSRPSRGKDAPSGTAAGAALLDAVLRLHGGDGAARESARGELATAARSLPTWADAWAHFLAGRSLLAEEGDARRTDGILELLAVPALHRGESPRLARRAVQLAAAALRDQGDATAADALERDIGIARRRAANSNATPLEPR